jgi:GT2 family glycosyltransferase
MNLTYICTNYNNSHYTETAVSTLTQAVGHDLRVYVVDNASSALELEKLHALSSKEPRVRVVRSGENLGYFRGLNLGIERARAEDSGERWYVIGNNDLEFPPEFCDRLESGMAEYSSYCVISPDIVTLDGVHQNPHVVERVSALRETVYDLYYSNYLVAQLIRLGTRLMPRLTRRGDQDNWRLPRTICQGHGSVYILSPRFFEKFASLWAPTFMMAEELFLSLQLQGAGERIWYSPAVRIIHHCHGALNAMPSRSRWALARDAHVEYRKYVKVAWRLGRF